MDALTQYGPIGGLIAAVILLAGAVGTLVKGRLNGRRPWNGVDRRTDSSISEIREEISELRKELKETRHDIRAVLQPLVTDVAVLRERLRAVERQCPLMGDRHTPPGPA